MALADKLHNTRAVVLDHRRFGDEVWARFNAPREGFSGDRAGGARGRGVASHGDRRAAPGERDTQGYGLPSTSQRSQACALNVTPAGRSSSLCRVAAFATLEGSMNDTPEHGGGEVVLHESQVITSIHGETTHVRDCVPPGVGLARRVGLHLPGRARLRKYATIS